MSAELMRLLSYMATCEIQPFVIYWDSYVNHPFNALWLQLTIVAAVGTETGTPQQAVYGQPSNTPHVKQAFKCFTRLLDGTQPRRFPDELLTPTLNCRLSHPKDDLGQDLGTNPFIQLNMLRPIYRTFPTVLAPQLL
ncbi:hypothetical protein B0J17DRAFT_624697 [Rhizoctonia solani]|nr:hypothetical protein B0J17DRAFT_624697 [Rhizoctonia solani]